MCYKGVFNRNKRYVSKIRMLYMLIEQVAFYSSPHPECCENIVKYVHLYIKNYTLFYVIISIQQRDHSLCDRYA